MFDHHLLISLRNILAKLNLCSEIQLSWLLQANLRENGKLLNSTKNALKIRKIKSRSTETSLPISHLFLLWWGITTFTLKIITYSFVIIKFKRPIIPKIRIISFL